MSDFQYYPKLPPIRSSNMEDDSSEETDERPSSVLDLGDIDVSCLTKAQTEEGTEFCQSENETDENARKNTNNIPTRRREGIPEYMQNNGPERTHRNIITPTNTPKGVPVDAGHVMDTGKILRNTGKAKCTLDTGGMFSYSGHVHHNTITPTNNPEDVRETAKTSCSEHILSSSITPTNMANYEHGHPATDFVERVNSESQCSVQVESVNSNTSCIAHFVEDVEPGKYKVEQNFVFPSPEMNIDVATKDDKIIRSSLAIVDAISGNEILPALNGSEHNDVISGVINFTDVDGESGINQNDHSEVTEFIQPKSDVDMSLDVDDAHQVMPNAEPKTDPSFPQISEENLPEVDKVNGSQHILSSIEEDISDDVDVDKSRRQTTPAGDDIISYDDDTDSSDVDFDYRMNLDDLDYDSDDNLLTPQQQEEQRLWDLEFEKRKKDLEISKKNAAIRREEYRNRLENLTVRWNGIEKRLENRQVEKRQQLYQNLQQLLIDNKRS